MTPIPPVYLWRLDSNKNNFRTEPHAAAIGPFSRVNLFCGTNNSGKSRVLRHIFQGLANSDGSCLANPALLDMKANGNRLNKLVGDTRQVLHHHDRGIWEKCDVLKNFRNDMHTEEAIRWLTAYNILCAKSDFSEEALRTIASQAFQNDLAPATKNLPIVNNNGSGLQASYISALRTCLDLKSKLDLPDFLAQRLFDQDINKSYITTGVDLFDKIKSCLLGSPKERKSVADFEKFLQDWFFDGKQVSLSPRTIKDRELLHIRIEPETELPVSQLGDGLQHVITILSAAFLNPSKFLVLFIEEPELYLHPSMQRRVLEALLRIHEFTSVDSMQAFVATHSNHLLDTSLDYTNISIFRTHKTVDVENEEYDRDIFEKHPTTVVGRIPNGDIRILRDIGASPSGLFLSNCTIWVEGPSDRIILRHYINLISVEQGLNLREDIDYSFVMYGGSLLERWNFLDESGPSASQICFDVMVVADGDIASKGDRVDRLRASLGEKFLLLPCREIENSIGNTLLSDILPKMLNESHPPITLPATADVLNDPLGSLIQNEIDLDHSTIKVWAAPDGGLGPTPKSKFPDMIVENVSASTQLPESIVESLSHIINFIVSNRPKKI